MMLMINLPTLPLYQIRQLRQPIIFRSKVKAQEQSLSHGKKAITRIRLTFARAWLLQVRIQSLLNLCQIYSLRGHPQPRAIKTFDELSLGLQSSEYSVARTKLLPIKRLGSLDLKQINLSEQKKNKIFIIRKTVKLTKVLPIKYSTYDIE